MQIAVLCSPDSWYLKDLRRAASERHELFQIGFRDLSAGLACRPMGSANSFTSGTIDLARMDAVLVRTMPPASLEQVVFRMDVLARLEAAGTIVLNPAKAVEAAVDKYLASAKLAAVGLTTPATFVCQATDTALDAFAALGGDVVLKPLFGGEGRGIVRLNDEAVAQRTFSLLTQLGAVLYLQQFIPHEGYDVRVLVLGERMWGMRRRNALDWRTNVSRGATPEPLEITPAMAQMAQTAADAIGAPLAGVDLLPGTDGTLYAIEVNAVPGWQALSRALDVDIARHVLDYVEMLETEKR